MNPQEALKIFIRDHGHESILGQLRYVKATLLECCPQTEYRRDIDILMLASGFTLPVLASIRADDNGLNSVIASLIAQLYDEYGVDHDLAQRAVVSWAYAIDLSGIAAKPIKKRIKQPQDEMDASAATEAGGRRPRVIVDAAEQNVTYTSISEAIRESVMPGTIIEVRPGMYREALTIERDVEIIGVGDKHDIVIEATNTHAIKINSPKTILKNITVRALGSRTPHGAIYVTNGRPSIDRCDLSSAIGSVIYISGADAMPEFKNCEIHDGKTGGIFIDQHGKAVFTSCSIVRNIGPGIEVYDGGNSHLYTCVIRDNRGFGVLLKHHSSIIFTDTLLHDNGRGSWHIDETSQIVRTGNRSDT